MVFESLICRGFALCRMLFDFVVKCITAQATKTVTLGPLVGPIEDPSTHNHEEKERKENKNEEEEKKGELPLVEEIISVEIGSSLENEEKIEPKVEVKAKGPPKKMVSINENAEVIYPSKDKRKRKRSFDKILSLDEQKPIKSILKVGSNSVNDKQL